MEDRKNFREGVDSQPEPDRLLLAAEPCSQFVQLEIGKLEIAEKVLVEGLSVHGLLGIARLVIVACR
jgi:hypothetical protein